jgi:nucleotide-binding universal stress UspA family protein
VPPGLVASAELRDGKHAYHEILAAAEQHNVDLIVIGRSGHTGLERVLLGSNVHHVLKNARCPVFVTT